MTDEGFPVGHALERFHPAVIRREWNQLDRRQQGNKLRKIGIGIYKWSGITIGVLFAFAVTQLAWFFHFFPRQMIGEPGHVGPMMWICLLVDGIEALVILPALLIFAGNKLRTGSFFDAY